MALKPMRFGLAPLSASQLSLLSASDLPHRAAPPPAAPSGSPPGGALPAPDLAAATAAQLEDSPAAYAARQERAAALAEAEAREKVIEKLAKALPESLGEALCNEKESHWDAAAARARHEALRAEDISPPLRGTHEGLLRPTFLQTLLQLVTLGHYWSTTEEAPPFVFAFAWGDWVTALWHFSIFSSAWQWLTCGACPRFRRLSNSYVAWDAASRTLRGTAPSRDELHGLKSTFGQLTLGVFVLCVLALGYGTLFPGVLWWSFLFDFASRSVSLGYLAIFVFLSIVLFVAYAALHSAIFSPSLAGTRPHSLPSLLSLICRVKSPHYMISYSWSGEPDHCMMRLAHALAEVLPEAWIDHRRLVPGQHLVAEMKRPVLHARIMIILLNPSFAASINCGHELLTALRYRSKAKGQRTIVLMEEDGLAEKGFSPQWEEIKRCLCEAGFVVARSVKELLEWLDKHGVHSFPESSGCCSTGVHLERSGPAAAAHNDIATLTLKWFRAYQFGRSDALGTGADFRLPWNFFIKEAQTATAASLSSNPQPAPSFRGEMERHFFFQECWTPLGWWLILRALLWHRPRAVDTTTGSGGVWIAANAMRPHAPHISISFTVVSARAQTTTFPTCLTHCLSPFSPSQLGLGVLTFAACVFLALVVALFDVCTESALQRVSCGAGSLGASFFLTLALLAMAFAFAVRWGDVLVVPSAHLHSPELLIPLLAQKINGKEATNFKGLHVSFVMPRLTCNVATEMPAGKRATTFSEGHCWLPPPRHAALSRGERCGHATPSRDALVSHLSEAHPSEWAAYSAELGRSSNCCAMANNLHGFLKAAGCESSVGMFPDMRTGFFGDGRLDANIRRTVYVLFLENEADLSAWVDSQREDAPAASDISKQVVLVASSRFLKVHRNRLFKWLVIEFAEAGRRAELTASGTSTSLSLTGAILSAVSMKLADLVLKV